ncbi:MFS transporter [Anaerotruncus sp. AF02-27]|uniref:MFS transporter n=1 Tax=Anaerotruncus sp. AF02-27 TaxID=2292191 RepID=UPI000E4C20F3|nr:MFS transporter [Anaerotruncus sp. AF02-27]RGX55862.1 MFS transporter [Anaerotruncus sp. AF02-27]
MQNKKAFHYAFAVAGAYCLVIPAIYLFSNPFSLYMLPIVEDLGISRGMYSLHQTVHELISAVAYFMYVRIQKKFGLRELATMGLLCAALSAICYSTAHSLPLLFIGGALSAMIWPLASQVTAGSIVNNWFAKKSGTVISIIFGCGNIAGFFNAKIIAHWIEHYGWRRSMFYTMIIMLVVAAIAYLVIRSHPSEKGVRAWGAPEGTEGEPAITAEPDPNTLPGAVFKDSVRNVKLYSAYAWCFITGIIVYPVQGIIPAQLQDIGFDAAAVSSAVGIMSIGSLVLLIPLGQVIDRWGIRLATVACVASYIGMIVLLLTITPSATFLATVAGFLMGAAILLYTILPLFMKEVFGFREFAKFMSYSVIFRTIGNALGSPMLNFVYDHVGSYRIVLLMFAVISVLLLVFGVIATSKKNPLWVETRPGYPGYVAPKESASV